MLLTAHTLTGALIALAVKDPALAAPLAFTSHFVLDSMPHFGIKGLDFKTPKGRLVGILDCTGALVAWLVMMAVFPGHWFLVSVGVFFACLPDLLYLPDIFLNKIIGKKLRIFHSRIQWGESPAGTVVDVIWAGVVIYSLGTFR